MIPRKETSIPVLAIAVRTTLVFSVLLLAWAFCLLRPDGAGAATTRPSFVLIQLDDFANLQFDSRWVDSKGKTRRSMPKTRKELLSRGVRFTNYLTPNPVCSPSRASMLTGRYSTNHPVENNGAGWPAFRNDPVAGQNLATWLQGEGYRTMHFGKLMNGYAGTEQNPNPEVPPGWDVWEAPAAGGPFYGYWLNLNGSIDGPFGPSDYGPGTEKDPVGCPELGLESCNYHTDVFTTRAIQRIEEIPEGEPALVNLGYHAPHGDSRPPPGPEPAVRHYGSASRTPHPSPPGFNERNVSDKPPWVRKQPRLGRSAKRKLKLRHQKSVEALRSVDESVGRIVAALERSGRLDNTFIFLFSDNGFFHGEHRLRSGKLYPYEPSVRVPMVIRGPGIPKEETSRELVANHDLAPTILSLAGAGIDPSVDGRSMESFWKRPGKISRRPILLNFRFNLSGKPTLPDRDYFYRGIRVGPYKFVEYGTGFEELYDLSRDPHELSNQVGDPRYRQVNRYMKRQLRAYWGCSGAECRVPAPRWPAPGPR